MKYLFKDLLPLCTWYEIFIHFHLIVFLIRYFHSPYPQQYILERTKHDFLQSIRARDFFIFFILAPIRKQVEEAGPYSNKPSFSQISSAASTCKQKAGRYVWTCHHAQPLLVVIYFRLSCFKLFICHFSLHSLSTQYCSIHDSQGFLSGNLKEKQTWGVWMGLSKC